MVNIILKFVKNKKNKDQLVAFDNKKVHFICHDSDAKVNAGEYWECFLWSEKEKYNLVKPFKKIEPENLEKEKKRVEEFNKELKILKNKLGDEFVKIVFDENNKPYLLSKLSMKEIKEKYPMFIVLEKNQQIWVRPIISPEDRILWRKQQEN